MKDFAKGTGLSRTTVHRHFKGEIMPSFEDRQAYARVAGVSFSEFEASWQKPDAPAALAAFLSSAPTAQAAALEAMGSPGLDDLQRAIDAARAELRRKTMVSETREDSAPQVQTQTAGDAGAGVAGKIGPEEETPRGRMVAKKSQQQRPKKPRGGK